MHRAVPRNADVARRRRGLAPGQAFGVRARRGPLSARLTRPCAPLRRCGAVHGRGGGDPLRSDAVRTAGGLGGRMAGGRPRAEPAPPPRRAGRPGSHGRHVHPMLRDGRTPHHGFRGARRQGAHRSSRHRRRPLRPRPVAGGPADGVQRRRRPHARPRDPGGSDERSPRAHARHALRTGDHVAGRRGPVVRSRPRPPHGRRRARLLRPSLHRVRRTAPHSPGLRPDRDPRDDGERPAARRHRQPWSVRLRAPRRDRAARAARRPGGDGPGGGVTAARSRAGACDG